MPTINQKNAVKDTIDNLRKGKKIVMGEILRKNGYSEAVATHPKIVLESKGWLEAFEEAIPDSLLEKVHKQFLKKREKIVVGVGKGYSEIQDTGQPHSDALKATELAYKIKGRLVQRTDLTSGGKPLILPAEVINKYTLNDSPPSTKPDSIGPA